MEGEVSFSTNSGVEFHRLTKGMNFGDVALLKETSANETAIAATKCSLLVLSKEDYLTLLGDFPEDAHEIKTLIEDSLQIIKQMKSQALMSKARGIFKDLLEVHTEWEDPVKGLRGKKSFHYGHESYFRGLQGSDGNRDESERLTTVNSQSESEALRGNPTTTQPRIDTVSTQQDKSLFFRKTK